MGRSIGLYEIAICFFVFSQLLKRLSELILHYVRNLLFRQKNLPCYFPRELIACHSPGTVRRPTVRWSEPPRDLWLVFREEADSLPISDIKHVGLMINWSPCVIYSCSMLCQSSNLIALIILSGG
jgi:hypothetical protein